MRYPFNLNEGIVITCDYNCHLSAKGARAEYAGTDYANGKKFPLYAIEDGYVSKGYDPYGALISILISKDGKRQWQYVHLDSQCFFGNVKEGDLIGYAGNSGMSSGIHLHLGLILNGVRIDPDKYLRDNVSQLTPEQMDEIMQSLNGISNQINQLAANVKYPYTNRSHMIKFNNLDVFTYVIDSDVYTMYFENGKWSKPLKDGGTNDTVVSKIINDNLVQMTIGTDNKPWERSSEDGKAWTDWQKVNINIK